MKGKIVLCEGDEGVPEALRVGAVGILTQGQTSVDTAYSYPLPGCYLQAKDAVDIHKYIRSTRYRDKVSHTLTII